MKGCPQDHYSEGRRSLEERHNAKVRANVRLLMQLLTLTEDAEEANLTGQ